MSNLNFDPNKNITFIKNNFRPEKITQKNVLDYLVRSEKSLQSMLDNSNTDVLIELQNLRAIAAVDDRIPKINEKLYAELLDTITLNKKRPLNLIYDKRLERLTINQEKIYRVLKKIEEDLIDEQDTSIKHSDSSRGGLGGLSLNEYIKKIIDDELKSRIDAANGAGQSGGLLGLLAGGLPLVPIRPGKPNKPSKPARPRKPSEHTSRAPKSPVKGKALSQRVQNFLKKITKLKSWKKLAAKIAVKAGAMALSPAFWLIYELISVFYKICQYFADAPLYIDYKYGYKEIESFIFAVPAATSEWVREQAELLEFIGEILIFILDNVDDFCGVIDDLVESTVARAVIKTFLLGPLSLIPHDATVWIINQVNGWIKSFINAGEFGSDAGITALEIFWDITDEWPAVLKKLFGGNEALRSAERHGYLPGGFFSSGRIAGTYQQLSKTYTTNELKEMAKHRDLGVHNLTKINEALKLKTRESDAEIMVNRKKDQHIQKVLNSLEVNKTAFGIEWYEFTRLCLGLLTDDPANCILEGHWSVNEFFTITDHNVLGGDDRSMCIAEAKDFFSALYTAIKDSGYNMREIDDWRSRPKFYMYFTVYGTIILQWRVRSATEFNRLKKQYKLLFPKFDNGYAVVNKVVGYFNPGTMRINALQVEPSDKVFKAIFTSNVILSREQNYYRIALTNTYVKTSEYYKNPTGPSISRATSNLFPNLAPKPTSGRPGLNGTDNDVSKQVENFLLNELKLTREQTAGVMGNIMLESSMNPAAVNNDGGGKGAHGLCQWRGSRYEDLLNFSRNRGTDPYDLTTQLEFLKHELEGTHKKAFEALKKAKTVEDAALVWSSLFEKGGSQHDEKHIAYALGYYNRSGTTNTSPPGVPSPDLPASANPAVNAARIATGRARQSSGGQCALYVREALTEAGILPNHGIGDAYEWRGKLEKYGFEVVHEGLDGFAAQAGDIVVINRLQNESKRKPGYYGHVAIYNGSNWISDFTQKGPSVYGVGAPNGAWYYRYKRVPTAASTFGGPDISASQQPPNPQSKPSESGEAQDTAFAQQLMPLEINSTPHEHYFGESEVLFQIGYELC